VAIASACAGTFLLAEAGILDGLRATTTWWLAPVFRARYPAVQVDQSQMVITSDGITTAGAALGHLDLALAIVRAGSPALADLVARYLVVDERPSQSVYVIPSALAQSDALLVAPVGEDVPEEIEVSRGTSLKKSPSTTLNLSWSPFSLAALTASGRTCGRSSTAPSSFGLASMTECSRSPLAPPTSSANLTPSVSSARATS
jgi:hypothetical protein